VHELTVVNQVAR